ncbi:MAG: hypothetical protein H6Q89_5127 [Myxococcaceae bacterium]|nr:hypothetical protein [Myxococcaceae bacterium]
MSLTRIRFGGSVRAMSAPPELPKPASMDPPTAATEVMPQVDTTAQVPTEAGAAGPAAATDPALVAEPVVLAGPAVAPGAPSKLTALTALGQLAWSRISPLARHLDRLPPNARKLLAASLLFAAGAAIALLFSRGGRSPSQELERWARRIAAPEGELVRSALSAGDFLSALSVLRSPSARDRLRADPAAFAVRARLALKANEPSDALESLELAITEHPKLIDDPWVAESVLQTFNAGRPARTGLLLARVSPSTALPLLRTASADWSWRVRHGAADALRQHGEALPDLVGFQLLDAWQTDRCDVQRAAVGKLRAPGMSDERIAPALEALVKRPGLQGCIDDLVPRTQK